LVLATPILEGTPPPESADVIVTEGRIIVDDSVTAADTVRWLIGQGYDAVKVYNNLNRSAYAGIVAAARQLDVPVVGHVPLSVGLAGVFEAHQSSIEHLRGYVLEAVPPGAADQPNADYRSRLVAWRHADTIRLRSLAERTAREGIWNTPTLGVLADLLPSNRIDEVTSRAGWKRCMRGRYADPIATRRRAPYFAVMTDADFAAAQEGVTVQKQLVRMLVESGAGLLVGTDRLPWGFAFHWELEELSEAGISAGRLLQAATIDAAEYLGQGDEIGTVEVGKRADLVLLGADPLESIRNAGQVQAVIANGIIYQRPQLETMIDAACEALSG
jgi:imidazolonepropionase-like amidohydrolase